MLNPYAGIKNRIFTLQIRPTFTEKIKPTFPKKPDF